MRLQRGGSGRDGATPSWRMGGRAPGAIAQCLLRPFVKRLKAKQIVSPLRFGASALSPLAATSTKNCAAVAVMAFVSAAVADATASRRQIGKAFHPSPPLD